MTPDSSVLEVGCGSGGYAQHLAEQVGCSLVGLDLNAPGVQNANRLASARGLNSRARFLQRFLSCVHTLTEERRLLRYLYLATKR